MRVGRSLGLRLLDDQQSAVPTEPSRKEAAWLWTLAAAVGSSPHLLHDPRNGGLQPFAYLQSAVFDGVHHLRFATKGLYYLAATRR